MGRLIQGPFDPSRPRLGHPQPQALGVGRLMGAGHQSGPLAKGFGTVEAMNVPDGGQL